MRDGSKLLLLLFGCLFLANAALAGVYGDGSDGAITRSSDGTESGILNTTSYKVESGVTRTVDGTTIIHATDRIVINGTIRSYGASGGAGGTSYGEAGGNGADGIYITNSGSGGAGGTGNGDSGNDYGGAGGGGQGSCSGGNAGGGGGSGGGKTGAIPSETETNSVDGGNYLGDNSGWNEYYNLPGNIAAGGAGGGAGGKAESSGGGNINGGNGGRGGGLIILIAPEIVINGKVSSAGEDGGNGQDDGSGSSCSIDGSGGGGGGGAGGLAYLVSETLEEPGKVTVTGGNNGTGGDGGGWSHAGGEGALGNKGKIYRVGVDTNTNQGPNISFESPHQTNRDPNGGVELTSEVTDPENDDMNITFYDASDDSKIGEVNNKGNGTYSVDWTGLSADQTYNWYAEVTDGTDTVKSDTAEFTTIDIDLSWTDNSNNEEGFNVYSNASGMFQQVGQTGENQVSLTDYNQYLEFGKYICYQVTAYNQYGESNPLEGCITP